MSRVGGRATSGTCIVCGHPTSNRTDAYGDVGKPNPNRPDGYKGRLHWRCPSEEFDACAERRNMRRKRPRAVLA